MKKTLLIVFLFASLCHAQGGSYIFRGKLDSILSRPFFDSTQIALSVYDLTEGVTIFEKNQKQLMRPASVLKILTTTAAFQFLKPDYKFRTQICRTGKIEDSVLTGDLFIKGGFSPDFSAGDLDLISRKIKEAGIKKIQGNIYADLSRGDSLFWGKGWMWDDDSDRDFPYLNSLPVSKNSVDVIVSPSSPGEMPRVTLSPDNDFVKIINRAVCDSTDTTIVSVKRNWVSRRNEIVITGTSGIKGRPDTSHINIVYPERFFLSLMNASLKKNGIEQSGTWDTLATPYNAALIGELEHSLMDAVTQANKKSDNLNAEMILRAIAYEQLKRKVSAADGIKYIDSLITLTGLKKKNYRIVDGSGLSFYNLISAELIVEVLKYARWQPDIYEHLLKSLPVAGVDGTLKNRLKDFSHLENINAKTGSISGVTTLAGYITTTHGHTMAFALLIQNFTGGQKRVRDLQDEICRAIYLIKSDKDE